MLNVLFKHPILTVLTALGVFGVLWVSPPLADPRPDVVECEAPYSSDCLVDMGVSIAQSQRRVTWVYNVMDPLAAMGRFEAAQALGVRERMHRGDTREEAVQTVEARLASHRLTEDIRAGADPRDAVARVPAADASALWISALTLLGQSPYGFGLATQAAPDAATLERVAEMADLIAEMAAEDLQNGSVFRHMYAVEVHATLGNRAEVVRLLEQIPSETREVEPRFSDALIDLLGFETALDLFTAAGSTSPRQRVGIYLAHPDTARGAALLRTAYDAFKTQSPWADVRWMRATVLACVEIGERDVALDLARDLATHVQTEYVFSRNSAYIIAAEALLAAGADPQEGLDMLDLVDIERASDDSLRSLAVAWARFGDFERSAVLLSLTRRPNHGWHDVLATVEETEILDDLLARAAGALTREDYHFNVARTVSRFAQSPDAADQAWAREQARFILKQPTQTALRDFATYRSLVWSTGELSDEGLQDMALLHLAELAVQTRDPGFLIRAGLHWENAGR